MSQSLADALHHYSPSDHYNQLGKAENCCSNAIYLAYNDNDGWYTVELNIFCRIVRYLFGAFRDTHLTHIAHRLSLENSLPENLKAHIQSAWSRAYPGINSSFYHLDIINSIRQQPLAHNFAFNAQSARLRIIYYRNSLPLTRDQLESILSQFPQLKGVYFSGADETQPLFTDENDVILLLNDPKIKALMLIGSFEGSSFIQAAAQRIHSNINDLVISSTIVNPDVLRAIGDVAPILNEICININEEQTGTDALIELFQSCTELKSLNLARSQITNATLRTIGQYGTLLEKLEITDCVGITDEGLRDISENCQNLKNLNISECRQLTPQATLQSLAMISTLESITLGDLSPITAQDLRNLLNACPRLHRIWHHGILLNTDEYSQVRREPVGQTTS